MVASSSKLLHRTIAVAFVFATAACADNLLEPATDRSLSPSALSLDKKFPLAPGARAFIDKNGQTVFEVSTTSQWDDPGPQPGQLTHVHFKLCKMPKGASTTKMFSANFHYKYPSGKIDNEKDDEVDDPNDPAYKSDPNRVNWDRSSNWTTIKSGGYSSGFIFTGLKLGDLVEVKISYGNPLATPTLHATLCVPVIIAPNPGLTLGITSNNEGSTNTGNLDTYTVLVTDNFKTATIRATCDFWVDGVRVPTVNPIYVTVDASSGGGICSFQYAFPEGAAGLLPHEVKVTLGGIYPVDYDGGDNSAVMTVQVGGTFNDPNGNPVNSITASFTAQNITQITNVPGNTTGSSITSYRDLNHQSDLNGSFSGVVTQGSTITITIPRVMAEPFDFSAVVSTSGSPDNPSAPAPIASTIDSFTVSGLTFDPSAGRGGPRSQGFTTNPFEQCTQFVTVGQASGEPVGYQVQVCVTNNPDEDLPPIAAKKTLITFETHASWNPGAIGHFVPYGSKLTFSSDFVSALVPDGSRLHYRITPQDIALDHRGTPTRPYCVRYAAGAVNASCTFYPGGNTIWAPNSDAIPVLLIGSPF